jgi:hypothetical protein
VQSDVDQLKFLAQHLVVQLIDWWPWFALMHDNFKSWTRNIDNMSTFNFEKFAEMQKIYNQIGIWCGYFLQIIENPSYLTSNMRNATYLC